MLKPHWQFVSSMGFWNMNIWCLGNVSDAHEDSCENGTQGARATR